MDESTPSQTFASPPQGLASVEVREWLDSYDDVIQRHGSALASELLRTLHAYSKQKGGRAGCSPV